MPEEEQNPNLYSNVISDFNYPIELSKENYFNNLVSF